MNIIYTLTIEQVTTAAEENAERYIDRAKGTAKQAFIEGVLWAQKQTNIKTQEDTV